MGTAKQIAEAFSGSIFGTVKQLTDAEITEELAQRVAQDNIQINNRKQILAQLFPQKHENQDFWASLPTSSNIFEEDDTITRSTSTI